MSSPILSVSELRELSQKATNAGQWRETDDPFAMADSRVWPGPFPQANCIATMQLPNCPRWRDDRRYIVAACNALPSILDRLEAAEKALAHIAQTSADDNSAEVARAALSPTPKG